MKKYLLITFIMMVFAACGNKNEAGNATETSADSTQTAALYQCPMHPEVTSNKPGSCSKCGMELEKKE